MSEHTDDILTAEVRARIADKTPGWVQEIVSRLESRVGSYGREAQMLRDAMEAAAVAEGTSDTMLVPEGDMPPRPLGDGAEVEFCGQFSVRADDSRMGGGPGIRVTRITGNPPGLVITTVSEEDIIIQGRML